MLDKYKELCDKEETTGTCCLLYTSYEEVEDYSDYEDTDKDYFEDVNDNFDSIKNNSVQGLVAEIETHLELLNSKIGGSEWKNEQQIIEKIKQLVNDFKHSANID